MLSEAEQYFGKILPININDIFSSFPSGISAEGNFAFPHNSDNRSLFIFFLSIFCGRLFRDYNFCESSPQYKMVPKVVVAWMVVRIPYLTMLGPKM